MSRTETIVDLRSDTVTKPCADMLAHMLAANVGDDQYQDDQETNLLQEEVADLLGKAKALWVPSGTMANQIALRTVTSPGDDVIVAKQSHAVWHEAGGGAANAGVHFTEVGSDGLFDELDFSSAIKPRGHHIYAPTTMVQIENTHNRCGGNVFGMKDIEAIGKKAKANNVFSYMDGARLWNASKASGDSLSDLATPVDAVMVSLSKGLGAPGGSVLAGSEEFIGLATRQRRMLGGAMRQTGYYAAAGRFAIMNNLEKLNGDHQNAKLIAAELAQCSSIEFDASAVPTNIIVFKLGGEAADALSLVRSLKTKNVLVNALDKRTIRLVTHLGVNKRNCEFAARTIIAQVNNQNAQTA